jgi:hypothetical protein
MSLVSEIVASGNDRAAPLVEWVNDNDLVMDDCVARGEQFGAEISERYPHGGRPDDCHLALIAAGPPDGGGWQFDCALLRGPLSREVCNPAVPTDR